MSTKQARPFDIAGIPQTISREARNNLIESLGIDIRRLVSLSFHTKSIEVAVHALNEKGVPYLADPSDHEPAKHVISIPVVD